MTDRRMDKMIIFGPEWLRNLSREGSSVSNNHQQNSGGATVPSVPTNPTPAPKYQLADYRYGREEMLALFDKHLEPPNELRDCQLLYIAKSQLPLALTNENFDEDARNNVPMGSPMAAERVGAPRGQSVDRGRGRGRLPFYTGYGPGRSQSTYHPTRGAEDANYGGESSAIPAQNRLWNPGNVSPMAPNARNGPEGSDWGGKEYNTRLFKRYPDNSNWRRQPNQNRNFGEDEGGWRAPELSRINRQSSMQNTSQDKWERDWNDRGRERPTSWNPTNRRPWTGDSQSPDDHLPEWAVDNSTDVGGTFDALGAFHGISSDDSAVPRYNTSGGDGQYGLSRSHTQGSLGNRGRNPIADDNYNNPTDDLWYTERHNLGKKVTKSTFDATEIKFRKSIVPDFDAGRQNAKVHKEQTDHHDDKNEINASSLAQHKLRENAPTDYAIPNPKEEEGYKELRKPGIVTTPKSYQHKADYKENKAKKSDTDKNYSEERHNQDEKEMVVPRDKENSNDELQRQFEGLMRNTPPDVDKQSVLITANNSLRQKHQNIVSEEISAPLSSQLVANDGATKDNMLSETDISQDSIVRNLWNTINFDHEDDLSMRNIPQIQQRQQLLGAGDGNVLPKTGPNLILGQNMMGNPDLHTIQSTQGLTNTDTRANSLHLQFMQQQQQQQQQTQQPYSAAMIALMQQKEMQLNFIPGYDKWYYEDPQLQTQGPFSSMEMTEWYRAGFFNGDLLVRRGHETHMRPLGIYGPIPPFMLATVPLAQLEMVSTAADQRPPQMPLGGPPPMGRAPNMVAAMSNIVDPAMKNILQFSNMGGNIPGNLAGNLTSNISANMSSNLTNNLTGNLSGNMATNLPGNSDLVGSPLMMQRMLSTPAETGAAGRMYGTPDMQQHKQNSAQGYQAEATMYRPYEQPPQMAFLHQLQQHTHLQDERMNQFQQPPPPLPSRNDMPSASLDLQSQRQEEPIKSFIRQLSSQQKQNEVESMWNMQGQYTWGPSVTTSSVSGSLPTSMWDMQV